MRGALDLRPARALDFGFALGVRGFAGSVHLPPAGWTRDSFAWRSSLLIALFFDCDAGIGDAQLLQLILSKCLNLFHHFGWQNPLIWGFDIEALWMTHCFLLRGDCNGFGAVFGNC